MSEHESDDELDALFAQRRETLKGADMPTWDELSIALQPSRPSRTPLWIGAALIAAACAFLVWPRPPRSTPSERPAAASASTETTPARSTRRTAVTPAAPKLERVSLRYVRTIDYALWIVAKQKGFFADEGLDVELVDVTNGMKSVSHDVTADPERPPLQRGKKYFEMGAVVGFKTREAIMHERDPIIDIGSMIMLPATLLMKKALAYKLERDPRAWRGLSIAELRPSGDDGKSYSALRAQLVRAGLKDGEDFKITEYEEAAAAFRDLEKGRVDAFNILQPGDGNFLETHADFVRVPFARVLPDAPRGSLLVTRDQLGQNRGRYVHLLRASIRAHQFAVEHPREAAEIIGYWLGLSPSLVRQSIMWAYVSPTPDPMRKGVEIFERTREPAPSPKTLVIEHDRSVYRDALFGLARENHDPASQGYFEMMISRFRAKD